MLCVNETRDYPLGRRVAAYRKAAKLSGEELAEQAGMGLTRSMIANLENGRKADLSVRQMLAVAFVLGVSPIDLVFDLYHPHAAMVILEGGPDDSPVVASTWVTADWFAGAITNDQLDVEIDGAMVVTPPFNPAAQGPRILQLMRRRWLALESLDAVRKALEEPQADDGVSLKTRKTQIQAELWEIENALRPNVRLDPPSTGPRDWPF